MTTGPVLITESPPDPRPRKWRAFGLTLRALQVRLRFIVILIAAFVVAGQWETLRNHWDRLTRGLNGGRAPGQAVSADTEYFCPMDPGVVSEWPGKCGICNMALVRRKVGDTAPLPSGILARMQFSPYRVQLAGIRTAPVAYEPLAREVTLIGSVQGERLVECDLFDRDRAFVAEGQTATVTRDDGTGRPALEGKVVRLIPARHDQRSRAVLKVDDPGNVLPVGTPVAATLRRAVAELEPFRSLPANPPPIRKGELRAVYLCPEHAEVLADQRGRCPVDRRNALDRQPLLDNQRVGWWCPMHANVTADRAGLECQECGGMKLVPRVITYRPAGHVLAVPESAVVDTGARTVVFIERMPGMFDGVEVVLGPRCGDVYPVAKGLEPGQRVATAGAFLIDAETRLNPSLAAAYFGSGRGARNEEARAETGGDLSGLSAEDQMLAAAQKTCPVTGKPLGSMGPPVPVVVAGKRVFLCCEGCEGRLRRKSP
ncbi:MAG: heavy metal-binding domain-containing protein [Isosphaeraceae bacterium]|nr:heavy metal-binding domain-containing protein [Isosphaeraceae bacterium]